MDINAITQLIGSVGFPIVMCFYMAYMLKDSEEKHKEEMDSLKDALNNNTLVLTELKGLLTEKNTDEKE